MIPEEFSHKFIKYAEKRSGGRYKYIMFTINFEPDTLLMNIMKQIKKCVKKKWIEKYMYCIETRNDVGDGVHCHLKAWIMEGKKPYDCKREVYNTFKHLVGNKMHVNVRYSNRDNCFEDYIKGIKEGKIKENHENDKRFRKFNNLKDIYIG